MGDLGRFHDEDEAWMNVSQIRLWDSTGVCLFVRLILNKHISGGNLVENACAERSIKNNCSNISQPQKFNL